jgi:hypothetical protein
MDANKVVEINPGVFQWLAADGETVITQTKEEILAEAKKANKTPHLGVYRWTSSDGTFRGN